MNECIRLNTSTDRLTIATDQPIDRPIARRSYRPTSRPTGRLTVQPTVRPTDETTDRSFDRPTDRPTRPDPTQPTDRPSNRTIVRPTDDRPTIRPNDRPPDRSIVRPPKRPTDRPTACGVVSHYTPDTLSSRAASVIFSLALKYYIRCLHTAFGSCTQKRAALRCARCDASRRRDNATLAIALSARQTARDKVLRPRARSTATNTAASEPRSAFVVAGGRAGRSGRGASSEALLDSLSAALIIVIITARCAAQSRAASLSVYTQK